MTCLQSAALLILQHSWQSPGTYNDRGGDVCCNVNFVLPSEKT